MNMYYVLLLTIDESMNPDAKLETENEHGNSGHVPENLDPHVYHPSVALKNAVQVRIKKYSLFIFMYEATVVTMPIEIEWCRISLLQLISYLVMKSDKCRS
jgi:hypothetical protein